MGSLHQVTRPDGAVFNRLAVLVLAAGLRLPASHLGY